MSRFHRKIKKKYIYTSRYRKWHINNKQLMDFLFHLLPSIPSLICPKQDIIFLLSLKKKYFYCFKQNIIFLLSMIKKNKNIINSINKKLTYKNLNKSKIIHENKNFHQAKTEGRGLYPSLPSPTNVWSRVYIYLL